MPCGCTVGSLHTTYTVAGTWTACAACQASAQPAWNGSFTFNTGVLSCSTLNWWAAPGAVSINGKTLQAGNTWIKYEPTGGAGGTCRWHMQVGCFQGQIVWEGQKTTGDTPAGTYTRLSGCDTSATRTVS